MPSIIAPDFITIDELASAPSAPTSNAVTLYFQQGNQKPATVDSTGTSEQVEPSVTTINELTDVTITTPTNGQLLEYSSGSWVNVDSPVPSNIEDLQNFNVNGSSSDTEAIAYDLDNLTAWTNRKVFPGVISRITSSKSVASLVGQALSSYLIENDEVYGDYDLLRSTYNSLNHFQPATFESVLDTGVYEMAGFLVLQFSAADGPEQSVFVSETNTTNGVTTKVKEVYRGNQLNMYGGETGTNFLYVHFSHSFKPSASSVYGIGVERVQVGGSAPTITDMALCWRKVSHISS